MMTGFKNLNVKWKLMASSGISVALMIIVGILSWFNMNEMRGTISQLEENFLPKANHSNRINDLYWTRRVKAMSYLDTASPAKRAAILAEIRSADKKLDEVVADYRDRVSANPEEKQIFDAVVDFIEKDRADVTHLVSMMDAGKQPEALKWQESKSTGLIAQSDQYFDALTAFNDQAAQKTQKNFKQTDQTLSMIFYWVNALVFLFMLAFAWWFSNLLGRALKNLTEAAKRVAAGDLTGNVERIDSGDEIGELSVALDDMLRSIRQIIRELKEKAAAVAASSDEMEKTSLQMDGTADVLNNAAKTASTATQQLEGNIRTVAAAVTQAASNVKEVFLSCKTVDDSGRAVGESADKLADNMQTMAAAAEEMSASVNTVAAAIEEMTASLGEVARSAAQAAGVTGRAENMAASTRTTVNALGESAQEIDKVVDLIQSIAAQTNLLALNATIEASSAGEAGKGFAVVAKEVKELAKQAAAATEVIRGRIEEMKDNTGAAIDAIGMITDTITQINDINNTIASSVEQQAATVQEVSRNVSGVATAAGEVSRNVLASATLAQDVAEKAEQTNSAVAVITRNLEDMDRGTIEISNSAQEAATGADRMSTSIAGVQTAAVDTNHGAGEIKHSAGTLTELSGQLVQLVGRFHLHQNFVNWTNAYSVGSRKIDVQHQRLFELVNQLHEAIQTGTERIVMSGILDELIEYTASHFGLEEKLMQQTRYPHYATHKDQHDKFVAQVVEFRKKFQAREADLNQEVMDMLVNWLTKHINGTDKQYTEHFQKTGVA